MEDDRIAPLVGMTFNMPREWHTKFKVTAAVKGITMHELLENSFRAYACIEDYNRVESESAL